MREIEVPQTSRRYPSSVAFLLSEDYEQVFSRFNFPEPTSPQETPRKLPWRTPNEPVDGRIASCWDANGSSANTPFRGIDWDLGNSVLDFDFFLSAPYEPSTRCASVEPPGFIPNADAASCPCTAADIQRLLSSVMTAPTLLHLQDRDRTEVEQQLQGLCRPACVARFISYYFDIWHRNCRIVHRPSFGLDMCCEPLVLAVIFLGAMYSSDAAERIAASAVIGHVESFIFSCLPSSSLEDEPCQDGIGVGRGHEQEFQTIQAAFLMVITLFWTGTEAQKCRAATGLFNDVVESARALGLMTSTQSLGDRRTEAMWLTKECRIRTANYLILTDCAFLFFKGLQLRLWDPEIECDLPCHEDIFDAVHPFTHPDFAFRRPLTTRQAFNDLFNARRQGSGSRAILTMLDSFVLIHMLYRFVNAALAVQLSRSQLTEEVQYPYDTITSDIRTALHNWFEQWTRLHEAAASKDEWDTLGFFKNGDQYAYATLLLLSSKARPHLRRLLRPSADRLTLLQELNKQNAQTGGA